ncbi:MAG: FkbM family methyltransferase [Lachnospiraceae bacterium]|nr:FkbM family methyltransferase [Lachnospiraceae bacterium]
MIEQRNIKKIYEAISDELSRKIFCSRLLYSMTGDLSQLDWMIEDFRRNAESNEKWIALKEQILSMKEKPYIFGTGAYGKMLCYKIGGAQAWGGFIDNSPKSDTCMELPVLKVKDFLDKYSGEKIVLPSKAFWSEMRKQLLTLEVVEENIIDGTAWYDATEGKQYFDLPYLTYEENEIFVDGGSCDGMSSVRFVEQCKGKYGKIYCFEPDEKNIEKLKRNFASRDIDNYEIIGKGLWDESKELSFAANGTANSHIAGEEENNVVKVEVMSLDEMLNGRPVSFVKMDIEGAEYKALEGARDTIARYKPKLAICVYHKAEDIWELPRLILEMRSDYNLYFRHYSDSTTETVLYAL